MIGAPLGRRFSLCLAMGLGAEDTFSCVSNPMRKSEDMELVTDGLKFPEGPIAMADGSVILVEIARGTLTRVQPDGTTEVIADLGGGPNGAAMGPDGAIYVCNNGGFEWIEIGDLLIPSDQPSDYSGGRIERVDLVSGAVDILYTECDGNPLKGPNDIVFDKEGGFWFTDHGKAHERVRDRGAVFYATPDGRSIKECVFPLEAPNGIGLSRDEDYLFVAETPTARLWKFKVSAPGEIEAVGPFTGECIAGLGGHQFFDSLALDANGNVCVATLLNGGITSISPDGSMVRHIPVEDRLTTNICFGGADLKTAYICLSSTGKLVKTTWDTPGLPLNFLNS
jgi:gluconolactonase